MLGSISIVESRTRQIDVRRDQFAAYSTRCYTERGCALKDARCPVRRPMRAELRDATAPKSAPRIYVKDEDGMRHRKSSAEAGDPRIVGDEESPGDGRRVTLRDIRKLDVAPIAPLGPTDIKKIRETSRVSQAVFARLLNTSVSTVQKWEIGQKKPTGAALKLLHLVQARGLEAVS